MECGFNPHQRYHNYKKRTTNCCSFLYSYFLTIIFYKHIKGSKKRVICMFYKIILLFSIFARRYLQCFLDDAFASSPVFQSLLKDIYKHAYNWQSKTTCSISISAMSNLQIETGYICGKYYKFQSLL